MSTSATAMNDYVTIFLPVIWAVLYCMSIFQLRRAHKNFNEAIKAARTAQDGWDNALELNERLLNILTHKTSI